MEDLLDNSVLVKVLVEHLAAFEQQTAASKTWLLMQTLMPKEMHIGDKGSSSGDNYDEKNIVKGSTIKAEGDFQLGDDIGAK